MRLIPHPQTSIRLIRRYPQKPCLPKLLPHLVRERILAVRPRRDFFGYLSSCAPALDENGIGGRGKITREFLHPLPQLLQLLLRRRREAGRVLGCGEAGALQQGKRDAWWYPRAGEAAGALEEEETGV